MAAPQIQGLTPTRFATVGNPPAGSIVALRRRSCTGATMPRLVISIPNPNPTKLIHDPTMPSPAR
jgi:hypothetical protein